MPQLWNSTLPGRDLAQFELYRLFELAADELPFASILVTMALEAKNLEELETHLVEIYRIALDDGHPVIPDMADALLGWVESVGGSPAASA